VRIEQFALTQLDTCLYARSVCASVLLQQFAVRCCDFVKREIFAPNQYYLLVGVDGHF